MSKKGKVKDVEECCAVGLKSHKSKKKKQPNKFKIFILKGMGSLKFTVCVCIALCAGVLFLGLKATVEPGLLVDKQGAHNHGPDRPSLHNPHDMAVQFITIPGALQPRPATETCSSQSYCGRGLPSELRCDFSSVGVSCNFIPLKRAVKARVFDLFLYNGGE